MRAKKVLPSKTALRKILKASEFDPRAAGPLKIIADVGNKDYYRSRAIELISDNTTKSVQQAISLLALSLHDA